MYTADILFSRSPNQSWNLVDCEFLSFKMWLLLLSFVSWNVSEHFCFTEIILGWRITLFTVISTTTATMFADICVKSVCKWVIAWSSDTTCHIWVNLISKGQSYLWFFFFWQNPTPRLLPHITHLNSTCCELTPCEGFKKKKKKKKETHVKSFPFGISQCSQIPFCMLTLFYLHLLICCKSYFSNLASSVWVARLCPVFYPASVVQQRKLINRRLYDKWWLHKLSVVFLTTNIHSVALFLCVSSNF